MKYWLILWCSLVSLFASFQVTRAEEWVYVGQYQDGAVDYYDKDSVKRQGATVFSRYKTVLPEPVILDDGLSYQYLISESKEDCQARTSVMMLVRGFTAAGKEVFSKSYPDPDATPLAPGSNGEFFQNMVCTPQLSKQKLEQLLGL